MSQSDYKDGLRGSPGWTKSGKEKRDWQAGNRTYLANKDLIEQIREAKNAERRREKVEEPYSPPYDPSSDNGKPLGVGFNIFTVLLLAVIGFFVDLFVAAALGGIIGKIIGNSKELNFVIFCVLFILWMWFVISEVINENK